MTTNLDQLLERKQATEDQIVTYLVAHFYAPMRHLALTILHDALAADDVAQETLLKAASRIHQYEPHTNLKAWVYRIGLNEARATCGGKRRASGCRAGLSERRRGIRPFPPPKPWPCKTSGTKSCGRR
jgi:DNA-directed RNA polymerase specialized sigma24 family protein